jgi:protein MBA1
MKHWLICATSVLNFKLKSMPNWTTRPKWKARRGKIAPTAKAMYREMLEAFAAGDKPTLHRICLGEFAKKLCAAIDRRDPKERVRFELVKYNRGLLYPKLMSHQIHEVNPYDKTMVTEQAVVAIASTQQASRVSAVTGETVPGSTKLQEKMEYVVLSRQANQKTFETGPWRIWGTTSVTSLEAYLKEKAVIDKEQAKRAGWTDSVSK